jgi:hypothetical protein
MNKGRRALCERQTKESRRGAGWQVSYCTDLISNAQSKDHLTYYAVCVNIYA